MFKKITIRAVRDLVKRDTNFFDLVYLVSIENRMENSIKINGIT